MSGGLPLLGIQRAAHRRIADEQERAASPLRLDSKSGKVLKIGPEVGASFRCFWGQRGCCTAWLWPRSAHNTAYRPRSQLAPAGHAGVVCRRLFRVTPFFSLVPKHRKQAPRPQFSLVATPFITRNHQEGASCLLNRSWLKAVRGPENCLGGALGSTTDSP